MSNATTRRDFMRIGAAGLTAGVAGPAVAQFAQPPAELPKYKFDISLAGWSLHRTIGEEAGKVPLLDMPKMTAQEFGINAIELVSGMMPKTDKAYLDELAKNAAANNVKFLLIMIDGQGNIGAKDEEQRKEAVEKHKQWIDTANYLGCHSIRMNWAGAHVKTMERPEELADFVKRSTPHFQELSDYANKLKMNVIIENHGGPSSYPDAVDALMDSVQRRNFGTLPDFGNFPAEVDKYEGIDRLMHYAIKAVSAKCYDFDDTTGLETKLDFPRLMEIVCSKHGYSGYVGIEYEGDRQSEPVGIKAAKALLERMRVQA